MQKDITLVEQQLVDLENDISFIGKSPQDVLNYLFPPKGIFRNCQEEIINLVLSRKDVLGILPTSAGKSICYQIPALLNKNMTLVVCPLKALMYDQIQGLQKKHVHSAFFINGKLPQQERQKIKDAILENKVKMLYMSPELLIREEYQDFLTNIKVDLIAIDEAHCISIWGHKFRPNYLKLSKIINILGHPPVLALTATATNEVEEDIQKQLNIKCKVIRSSFDRPNLKMSVVRICEGVIKEGLLKKIRANQKGASIIYARTTSETEYLSDYLMGHGFISKAYHSRIDEEEKKTNQSAFGDNSVDTIVATIAFGMGVDKDDIRSVIHYNIPQSVEGYYQEIGRAGRDGEPANCILIYDHEDVFKTKDLTRYKWPQKSDIINFYNYLKGNKTNEILTTKFQLKIDTRLDEIAIRLILFRLEEAGAINLREGVPTRIKIENHKHFHEKREKYFNSPQRVLSLDAIKVLKTKTLSNKKTQYIKVIDIQEETGMSYNQILDVIYEIKRTLKVATELPHTTDFLIQLNNTINDFDLSPVISLFEEIMNNSLNKIDILAQCMNSRNCLRANILNYFHEKYNPPCNNCSSCSSDDILHGIKYQINDNYVTTEELMQLEGMEYNLEKDPIEITILKTVLNTRHLSLKDISKILTGSLHVKADPWKFRLKSSNLLKDKEVFEVEETIKILIDRGFLSQSSSGEELNITRKGVNYIEPDRIPDKLTEKYHRQTYCWNCHADLKETDKNKCDVCGWIKCKCNACGCQFSVV